MDGPKTPRLTRRRVLRALLWGGAALGTAGGVGVAGARDLSVTRHARALPGLRAPLRLVFLSDLHFGLYVGRAQLRTWVEAANAERPDLVLLGGDQTDKRSGVDLGDLNRGLLAELAALRAPLGVYGVWGNHDYGGFGRYGSPYTGRSLADWQARREQTRRAYAGAGITVLRDEGRALRDDLHLGGVDDLWWGQPDARAALAGAGARATLLLSHNPDVLPTLPVPAGLVLSGHTHGGQVRLPLIGAPVVPSRYGQRYAMGWVAGAHGTPAYVGRGLGTSGLPLRALCPPEIVVLTLRPAGE